MRASPPTLNTSIARAFYGDFRTLRPAQTAAIEPVLQGNDVLVLSRTGSGKTEAVVAPLVDRFLAQARSASGCTLLYVTPTRALANDLIRRLERPFEELGLIVGVRHGERDDLSRANKPDLVITTPESLDVLLMKRAEPLQDVQAVILDEVHLTYNTQRGFQLAVLLHRLEGWLGRSVQVCGLSASVARPPEIWRFLLPGREVSVIQDAEPRPIDCVIRPIASAADVRELLDVIGRPDTKVLIFARSRRECDGLAGELAGRTSFGDRVLVHHSSLHRDLRVETERRFAEYANAVCIATTTLELGIDIGDIDLVILYGSPPGWESFVQRIGRGNRRSNKSNVLGLAPPEHGPRFRNLLAFEGLLSQVRGARFYGSEAFHIYGAAVQQVLSMILERGGGFTPIADLVNRFEPWGYLDRPAIDAMLDELESRDFIRRHEFQHRVGASDELHRLRDLRMIWGNFPARSRAIRLMVRGRELGTVPASNLLRLRAGIVVRFAGRDWAVARVAPDHVDLEASGRGPGIPLTYAGRAPGIDVALLQEMLSLVENPPAELSMPASAAADFERGLERMAQAVGRTRIGLARDAGHYIYITFAGRIVNTVVGLWTEEFFEADDFVLQTRRPVDFSRLPTDTRVLAPLALSALDVPEDLTVFQSLLPRSLLERELLETWAKSPVFGEVLQRLASSEINRADSSLVAMLV